MLKDKPIFILVDPSASESYIAPRIVELCELQQNKFENSWLVQLAMGMKRKVTNFVKCCEFNLNCFNTQVYLNILSLGYYDILIGMDWLEKNIVILNCYDKKNSSID